MTDGAPIASEPAGGVAAADGPGPAVRVADLTMEFPAGSALSAASPSTFPRASS